MKKMMNEAVGGVRLCFGRCLHCLLAMGKNNIIIVFANRATASVSLWEDGENISTMNVGSNVERA